MKKGIWVAAGVLVLLIGYVMAGPFLAVYQIKGAIKERDQEALAEHVDFPVLRGNLKEQLNGQLMGEMASSKSNDAFAMFGMMLADKLVDVMVDSLVTPASLARLMAGEKVPVRPAKGGEQDGETGGAQKSETGDQPTEQKELLADASYHFRSTSRFVARVTDRKGRPLDFVLTRDGLSWRLTNIVLPL